MKLSEYAKQKSISYRTAHRHWKAGLIKGEQLATGTIVVYEDQEPRRKMDALEIIEFLISQEEWSRQTGRTTALARMVQDDPAKVLICGNTQSSMFLKKQFKIETESLYRLDKLFGTKKVPILDNYALYELLKLAREEIISLKEKNKKQANQIKVLHSSLLEFGKDEYLFMLDSATNVFDCSEDFIKSIKDYCMTQSRSNLLFEYSNVSMMNTDFHRIQVSYVSTQEKAKEVLQTWLISAEDWSKTCEFDYFVSLESSKAFCSLLNIRDI